MVWKSHIFLLSTFHFVYNCQVVKASLYEEHFRPQVHYSPKENWMNDPNGLIYRNGVYHLFYQYCDEAELCQEMHWGHAQSNDLIHWQQLPVALSPNALGEIFSGCAVIDKYNVTGLVSSQPNASSLVVAVFTQNLILNDGGGQLQQQSMAYSDGNVIKFKMYEHNPIIRNFGLPNFRDPKVINYNDEYYVLVLAAGDRVFFYKSIDLINWKFLSEFGSNEGSHAGVWECPDLFRLKLGRRFYWILVVSINPGGPNKGSATQYFVGHFDGVRFENYNLPEEVLWLDYGPDNYAGDSWFGATSDNQVLFISWMDNWLYAIDLPTQPWRGQMTLPRYLSLKSVNNSVYLTSSPVQSISKLYTSEPQMIKNVRIVTNSWFTVAKGHFMYDVRLTFNVSRLNLNDQISLCFANKLNERICLNYFHGDKSYVIDRSQLDLQFSSNFTLIVKAPRLSNDNLMKWRLIFDVSSVEFYGDDGLTSMTAIFFPKQKLDRIQVKVASIENSSRRSKVTLISAAIHRLKSIWNQER